MEDTDAQLIARYLRGQVEALELLVARYQRPLYGFILQMTSGRDDADDIFQEVWIRVIRKAGRFREGNFLGWLARIARNVAIDRSRRRKPDLSLDAEDDTGRTPLAAMVGPDRGPLQRLVAADTGESIRRAVAELPAEQREVFVMRSQLGLPFKEIAKIQRTSINTALARMHYALAKLRRVLKDDYAEITGAEVRS